MNLRSAPFQLAFAFICLSLCCVGTADSGPAATTKPTAEHTFTYAPPVGTPTVQVSVAGDFNGWSAATNPLVRAADGTYSVTIALPIGLHHYKIVTDGKWIADPGNLNKPLESDDGHGGKNSGFIADALDANHEPTHTFIYTPQAGAATVPVSIAGDFNGWSASPNPMVRGEDGIYSVTVTVPPGLHHYKIVYDGKWIADPINFDKSLESDDGHEGRNSGFVASSLSQNLPHTFSYKPPASAATVAVSVAADFNGWSGESNPMTRGADGTYTATIRVTPGLHHYKIVYDGKWITDPANHDTALETDDGFNGKNSGFIAADNLQTHPGN